MDVSKSYEDEYNKWHIAKFTPSQPSCHTRRFMTPLWYVTREGMSRTGLLSYATAIYTMNTLRARAADEAAARAEETMQICVPDWVSEAYA